MQLLPDGLALQRRRLELEPPSFISYTITEDDRLRTTNNHTDLSAPEFPIESQRTNRQTAERVNPWLLVLNAFSKFRFFIKYFGWLQVHPKDQEVVDLTMEIATLIFEQPALMTGVGMAAGFGGRWSSRELPRKRYEDGDDKDRDMTHFGGGKEDGGDAAGAMPDGAMTYQTTRRSI